MTIGRERGQPMRLPEDSGAALITVHPSYLLRLPDKAQAEDEFGRFVDDLRKAWARIG